MSSTTETIKPGTSDYHWVMTVQTADGRVNTRTAIITVPDGFSRADAFDYVFKQFKDDYGIPITVVFFALESNQL
ncbi:hypothetical protein [Streptomyces sp. NPDC050428]|uniref:hypothetical protein n=1 Tax=Streptomyces sp. NPDC050428 TaxID=3155757 RepID=UPI003436BE59